MRAVLTYHSIDGSESPVSVSEERFRAHVRWLASGRVRVVPLGEIASVPDDEDVVALTFDDALESFGRVAAPILAEAGLPVTVFVPTGFVGSVGAWAGTGGVVPRLRVLGWDELRDLARAGVELGAHTRTHPVLTRLSEEALDDELRGSRERIEQEAGVSVTSFAYPYGVHDPRVVAATARVFEVAVTAELDVVPAEPHPLLLPRLDMCYFRGPRALERWGTPSFRGRLALRRLARRARRAVTAGVP